MYQKRKIETSFRLVVSKDGKTECYGYNSMEFSEALEDFRSYVRLHHDEEGDCEITLRLFDDDHINGYTLRKFKSEYHEYDYPVSEE